MNCAEICTALWTVQKSVLQRGQNTSNLSIGQYRFAPICTAMRTRLKSHRFNKDKRTSLVARNQCGALRPICLARGRRCRPFWADEGPSNPPPRLGLAGCAPINIESRLQHHSTNRGRNGPHTDFQRSTCRTTPNIHTDDADRHAPAFLAGGEIGGVCREGENHLAEFDQAGGDRRDHLNGQAHRTRQGEGQNARVKAVQGAALTHHLSGAVGRRSIGGSVLTNVIG